MVVRVEICEFVTGNNVVTLRGLWTDNQGMVVEMCEIVTGKNVLHVVLGELSMEHQYMVI